MEANKPWIEIDLHRDYNLKKKFVVNVEYKYTLEKHTLCTTQ